ncbi:MAG: acetate--CoA ligase family protein [bacterium]
MINTLYNLDLLLKPSKIAIIGLSSNPEHISYSLMENIVDNGYEGVVYPVNPKIKAIKGIRCYPKIEDIPDMVDVAILILKPSIAMEVLEDAAKIGIKNFIIISSGFAETGNVDQEIKIKELTQKYGLTVLGPNCVGVINTYYKLNASFATKGMPYKGSISIISQSGGFSIGIIKHLIKFKQGISKLISVGNKAVLNEVHFLEYLENDESTRIIALYVEDIKDFEGFEDVAYRLLEKGKPIVVFKGGQTQEGSVASSSHTAAITETNDYYKALFNKTGCIYTQTIEELYFTISTLEKNPEFLKQRGKRVLIMSNCGGCAVINTDFVIKNGFEVNRISEALKSKLSEFLPAPAALNNPIDIVGDADHNRVYQTVKTLIDFKNEYDYLIINIGQQSTINMEEVCKTLYNLSSELEQNNIAALSCMFALDVSQKEYEYIHLSKIPVFVYPEHLAKTLRLIYDYNQNRTKILFERTNFVLRDLGFDIEYVKQIVSQDQKINGFLDPFNVVKILQNAGVKMPQTLTISDSQEVNLDLLEYPVVLKTASPYIIHKTDSKAIYLNIKDEQDLRQKIQEISQIYPKMIIQKMIPNDIELILGMRKSNKIGKTLVILGIGGIFVELYKNYGVGLLPLDNFQLDSMLESIKISKIFEGFRGKKYSKTQFIETVNKLSNIISNIDEIEEFEINPLIINQEGVFVVDCRIKCYQ